MAKQVSNYEKLSLDLILYGEAEHVPWLLRNTETQCQECNVCAGREN